MAAPKGNRFWEARTKHGRDKKFTADSLWSGCVEYFKWIEENPLNEEKLFCYQGEVVRDSVVKMRAMTIKGLQYFLRLSDTTWQRYRTDEDFSLITREAEQIIYDQKFQGASADLLNANIIARELGLADKKEVDNTHKFEGMSDEELQKRLDGFKPDG